MTVADFVEETASSRPAGRWVGAAAVGAMGAPSPRWSPIFRRTKRGWEDRWEAFSDWAEKGKQHYVELLRPSMKIRLRSVP